jgi:hypothetical protein
MYEKMVWYSSSSYTQQMFFVDRLVREKYLKIKA